MEPRIVLLISRDRRLAGFKMKGMTAADGLLPVLSLVAAGVPPAVCGVCHRGRWVGWQPKAVGLWGEERAGETPAPTKEGTAVARWWWPLTLADGLLPGLSLVAAGVSPAVCGVCHRGRWVGWQPKAVGLWGEERAGETPAPTKEGTAVARW